MVPVRRLCGGISIKDNTDVFEIRRAWKAYLPNWPERMTEDELEGWAPSCAYYGTTSG